MQNRITITIAEQKYTLLATEDENYVRGIADQVDVGIKDNMKSGTASLLDAAILTALNFADEKAKEQAAAENLRVQIKSYLEESAQLKSELSEAKREIFKLQNKK